MRLKEAIQHTSGLRCVVEGMEICSSVGRRMLHEMTWLGEESAEHDRIASVLRLLETEAGRDRTETIRRKLALLRDIRSTIERTGDNCVFDDIELFELKFFALLAEELRPLASQGHLAELPELNGVVDLLDPEGNRLPHFFVYDAYSEELATLQSTQTGRSRRVSSAGVLFPQRGNRRPHSGETLRRIAEIPRSVATGTRPDGMARCGDRQGDAGPRLGPYPSRDNAGHDLLPRLVQPRVADFARSGREAIPAREYPPDDGTYGNHRRQHVGQNRVAAQRRAGPVHAAIRILHCGRKGGNGPCGRSTLLHRRRTGPAQRTLVVRGRDDADGRKASGQAGGCWLSSTNRPARPIRSKEGRS